MNAADADYVVWMIAPLPDAEAYEVASLVSAKLGLERDRLARLLARREGPVTKPMPREQATRLADVLEDAGVPVRLERRDGPRGDGSAGFGGASREAQWIGLDADELPGARNPSPAAARDPFAAVGADTARRDGGGRHGLEPDIADGWRFTAGESTESLPLTQRAAFAVGDSGDGPATGPHARSVAAPHARSRAVPERTSSGSNRAEHGDASLEAPAGDLAGGRRASTLRPLSVPIDPPYYEGDEAGFDWNQPLGATRWRRPALLLALAIAVTIFVMLQQSASPDRAEPANPYLTGLAAYRDGAFGRARAQWSRAGADGDARALYMLGYMSEHGQGRAWSNREAAEYYRQAAERGSARAQFALGSLYERGLGVPHAPRTALRWYEMAGAQGHPEAQFRAGLAYFLGTHVERDLALAREWFALAAGNGVPDAAAYAQVLQGDAGIGQP